MFWMTMATSNSTTTTHPTYIHHPQLLEQLSNFAYKKQGAIIVSCPLN